MAMVELKCVKPRYIKLKAKKKKLKKQFVIQDFPRKTFP